MLSITHYSSKYYFNGESLYLFGVIFLKEIKIHLQCKNNYMRYGSINKSNEIDDCYYVVIVIRNSYFPYFFVITDAKITKTSKKLIGSVINITLHSIAKSINIS